MSLVDLSHRIEHGMTTYPGIPGPEIGSHLSFEESVGHYAEGTEFQIGRISMVANTGTYLDTPAHRYRSGHDLAGLDLGACADLPTVLVDARGVLEIDAAHVAGDVDGCAVLLRTDWSQHWGSERYGDPTHPHLTQSGADALVTAGARLVGIDSVNVDDTRGGGRPAHSTLLAAGIPVVEHLTALDQVPPTGGRFHATPPRVSGLATFPVRAYVVLP